jgi:hypothetical protein
MKPTGVKVKAITHAEMLNHPAKAYNQSEWEKRVKWRIANPDVQFYVAERDELYSYDRFYVTYRLPEGLLILSEFSPYSSSLTNNGFKRATIVDGEIHINGWGPGNMSGIKNTPDGRKWLVENVCSQGVMVTSCF